MNWTAAPDFSVTSKARLDALVPLHLPAGAALFHAGELAQGFAIVLAGRIDVFLTSTSGREILLYSVEVGESCIQSTLGLIGDAAYTGDAVTGSAADIVLIPKPLFQTLMDTDPAFRRFVMQAFARRMHDVTRLLEQVAFGRIESRLAAALLDLAQNGTVAATHAELATRIGSAREVVSRRIEAFVRSGWVSTDRGFVQLLDIESLRRLAAAGV